jgi:Domain of unknown function (DUF4365)
MLSPTDLPRKKRTRQQLNADLCANHIEGFVLEEGHVAQRLMSDEGNELVMFTFDGEGFLEPGSVYFQIIAVDFLQKEGLNFVYEIDIGDYQLWTAEENMVVLVLFEASRKRAHWVPFQHHFAVQQRKPKKGAKTVMVRIPNGHTLSRIAISDIRYLKRKSVGKSWGF